MKNEGFGYVDVGYPGMGSGQSREYILKDDREIKMLNRSEELNKLDPYRDSSKDLSLKSRPYDINLDNYYHDELSLEDEVVDAVDNSERDGEIGYLMEKYGLEDFELEALMKEIDEHVKSLDPSSIDNNPEIPKYIQKLDSDDLRDLVLLYRPFLRTRNEYGLPFSQEELAKISEADREKLANKHQEKPDLLFKIAKVNDFLNKLDNGSDLNDSQKEEVKKMQLDFIALLAQEKNDSETGEPKQNDSETGEANNLTKKGTAITLRPEVRYKKELTDFQTDLQAKLKDVNKQIRTLEEPIYKATPKVTAAEAAIALDKAEMLRKANELAAKEQEVKEGERLWKEKPTYSEFDNKLRNDVLAYVRRESGARRPSFKDETKLNQEQIEDVLREIAKIKGWYQGNFKEEVRKIMGKNGLEVIRQLVSYDENIVQGVKKTIKYIFESENLPAGQYFFEPNYKKIKTANDNPNSAIAPISLFISKERPNKELPESIVKQMKVAAEEAAAKAANKPEIKIVKKGTSVNPTVQVDSPAHSPHLIIKRKPDAEKRSRVDVNEKIDIQGAINLEEVQKSNAEEGKGPKKPIIIKKNIAEPQL